MASDPKTVQVEAPAEQVEAVATPESRREQGRRNLNRQIAQRQKLLLVGVGAMGAMGTTGSADATVCEMSGQFIGIGWAPLTASSSRNAVDSACCVAAICRARFVTTGRSALSAAYWAIGIPP